MLMVAGDYLSGIQWIPSFLKHAPDIGFTIADVVAPAFVFIIGLNFGPSFQRRLESGISAAYRHFFLRYLSLIGIGAIISAGASMVGKPDGWGVLQALGVAGIITLAVVRFPTWARFVLGLLLLAGYQFFLDAAMLQNVLESSHGGLFGAISWSGLLILATVIADFWRKEMTPYLLSIAAVIALAVVSALLVPISKNRVSFSYVLLTLAISAVVFLLFELSAKAASNSRGLLCWWGENALALYLIHLLALSVFVTPGIDWWYLNISPWLAALQLAVIIGFMSTAAFWMHSLVGRKGR